MCNLNILIYFARLSIWITQFVSAGVLTSTELTLGVHDGVTQKDTSGQGVDVSAESMTDIERMMRKLL